MILQIFTCIVKFAVKYILISSFIHLMAKFVVNKFSLLLTSMYCM